MPKLTAKPKRGQPVVQGRNVWERQPDGSYRSGNIVLKQVRIPNHSPRRGERGTWFIHIRVGRKLIPVCNPHRPYGYGHVAEAKIGASNMTNPQPLSI